MKISAKYRLYQIDSFSKKRFFGNPAGVITNADGLTGDDMQKIARELNNSETAFVFSAVDTDHDVYIRYFTPTREVPICGHATIAAHYARAVENNLDSTTVRQKSGAGILPVDIVKIKGDYRIIMTQGQIEYGKHIEGENKRMLLSALGINEGDLVEGCPVRIVSTGHSKVMIGVRNEQILNRIKPELEGLRRLSEGIGCNGYHVFTLTLGAADVLVKGRMFAPAIGINEDPVTGNANGPLGAYLIHHGIIKCQAPVFRFSAMQGEAVGRPGVVDVEVSMEGGEPSQVRISGEAVVVFQAELRL